MELVEHTTPQQQPQSESEQITPELDNREQELSERLIVSLRGSMKWMPTGVRQETLDQLTDAVDQGKDPELIWRTYKTLFEGLEPIAHTVDASPRALRRAIETVTLENRCTLDPVDEINAIEEEFRAAVDQLPPIARAAIGIIERVACLEGLSVGVDFGDDILNALRDEETIRAALVDSGNSETAATLARVHELAAAIHSAEGQWA